MILLSHVVFLPLRSLLTLLLSEAFCLSYLKLQGLLTPTFVSSSSDYFSPSIYLIQYTLHLLVFVYCLSLYTTR